MTGFMSIKALNHNITFKPALALPLIQREQFTDMKHLYKVFLWLFLCYKHSNNHRSTGIKVYSSDINTAVYRSDQNRINKLFESDDASNKDCINYNVLPAGGDVT